ncbi:nuclear transport factor 2 family protein [Amycolatopsis speibonae]|uniref:Nuclear transport factor 2 family protein n=1 Tax=Amycolatopsis speibonae TaxID=1450224 RepID=A0ABV7NV81_9PSEU
MTGTTRETVQAYHRARFAGDVPAAAALLDDTFVFRSPMMTSDADGHLAGLPGFLQVVTGVDMISELYGDTEATLVYDVHTVLPMGTQRTAEHFRLRDGRIESITLIFDATPWHPVPAAAGSA